MLLRLRCPRLLDTRAWKKVLNCKTHVIPKIHPSFIGSSSFATCKNINNSPIKQNEANINSNGISKNYFETFRSNPYVRIMRLDRPIGEVTIAILSLPLLPLTCMTSSCFRIIFIILALRMVYCCCGSARMLARSLNACYVCHRCHDYERSRLYNKRHVGQKY
jgi:hypothetical protein